MAEKIGLAHTCMMHDTMHAHPDYVRPKHENCHVPRPRFRTRPRDVKPAANEQKTFKHGHGRAVHACRGCLSGSGPESAGSGARRKLSRAFTIRNKIMQGDPG
jgi:hypothetical protein